MDVLRSWRTRRLWPLSRYRPRSIPTGVILELDDGDQVGPLPLRYYGRCGRGHHKWAALAAARLAPRVRAVAVSDMPTDAELSLLFLPDTMLADLLDLPPEPRTEPSS